MASQHSPMLTPADIARVALKRLGELGLAPTPENYAKFYNAIATIKSPSDKSDVELKSAFQVLFRVADLLDGVNDTTEALLSELRNGGEGMSASMDALKGVSDIRDAASLLAELIEHTDAVVQTVSASHDDLQELKASINKIQSELSVNRKAMEHDPLTGSLNRQGLESTLAKEVKRSRRAASPISVAIVEMDDFKRIADQFGHLTSDKALLHFSSVAKAVLRETDQFARYGSEEFLLLLPETDASGARFLIDRLRLVNAKTPYMHQQQRIDLHFCAGIAQLTGDENAHAMLLRTEHAVSAAKSKGLGQVVMAV